MDERERPGARGRSRVTAEFVQGRLVAASIIVMLAFAGGMGGGPGTRGSGGDGEPGGGVVLNAPVGTAAEGSIRGGSTGDRASLEAKPAHLPPVLTGSVHALPAKNPVVLPAPTRDTFALTATSDDTAASVGTDTQGFSVESADLAHGFLTQDRLAPWLRTLGPHGVIRLGGSSTDLVWPAFGASQEASAPGWAIGGTVDQGDLSQLRRLLDASGWKVTLGAPLTPILHGDVSMDQVVDEAAAARATLGDDLLAVEVGNEFDHVTDLTPAAYLGTMKRYRDALEAAGVHVKLAGPSANTAETNEQLDGFVSAALADPDAPVPSELTSHWYPTSNCGTSNASIEALMSAGTHTTARTKLQGIAAIGARLPGVPVVINESNSTACGGQAGVSDTYATSLWSLDYLLETAQNGVSRINFHTNTAAICGDRYDGAFCAADQAALDAGRLSAAPLYYGLWAFRQVPAGRFVALDLADADLPKLRAYGVESDTGGLTMVLINVQDPAAGTRDAVTLTLPRSYHLGRSVLLTGTGGLASTDASGITLGGRTVSTNGMQSGTPDWTSVPVDGRTTSVTVAPGTAQVISFS
jgi:hypothetical protein